MNYKLMLMFLMFVTFIGIVVAEDELIKYYGKIEIDIASPSNNLNIQGINVSNIKCSNGFCTYNLCIEIDSKHCYTKVTRGNDDSIKSLILAETKAELNRLAINNAKDIGGLIEVVRR